LLRDQYRRWHHLGVLLSLVYRLLLAISPHDTSTLRIFLFSQTFRYRCRVVRLLGDC
jgi:hypothetical protein